MKTKLLTLLAVGAVGSLLVACDGKKDADKAKTPEMAKPATTTTMPAEAPKPAMPAAEPTKPAMPAAEPAKPAEPAKH